jgi:hypothetical protein
MLAGTRLVKIYAIGDVHGRADLLAALLTHFQTSTAGFEAARLWTW